MADASLFTAMFGFVSVFYGILVPLLLLQSLTLLFIPSMMKNGAQPRKVGEAIFCYLMQSLGILLMTAGALPTLVSVLAGVELAGTTYFTLLVIFAAGGILFLWHDNAVHAIDEAFRAVPGAIFLIMFKIIGYAIVLLWVLSLITTLMNGIPEDAGWWIMPLVMILYGLLLAWCTRSDAGSNQSVFQSITVNSSSLQPAKKNAIAAKRRKR
ncbi:hypothetical protein COU79_05045 [Candidatus Peregrinibacteria bacterium CG10_big_fil_rev_8_21_14_0_10_54_7]|nr:MAG: hypothetical protein COU79_05045 [Candidatus Peregrinibacteria bacterium CG10_big_fil_rev_8_21_14_0_10_54_7]